MEDAKFLENMLVTYRMKKTELDVKYRISIAEHEAKAKQLDDLIWGIEKHLSKKGEK